MFTVSYKRTPVLLGSLQAASTICITMKFAKLFVHALLAVVFVQTELALVQGEHEETGQCKEVLLVLVVRNIILFNILGAMHGTEKTILRNIIDFYRTSRIV